jgi:hypothetical protein
MIALRSFTSQRHPQEYAMLQNNIAIAALSMPLLITYSNRNSSISLGKFSTNSPQITQNRCLETKLPRVIEQLRPFYVKKYESFMRRD